VTAPILNRVRALNALEARIGDRAWLWIEMYALEMLIVPYVDVRYAWMKFCVRPLKLPSGRSPREPGIVYHPMNELPRSTVRYAGLMLSVLVNTNGIRHELKRNPEARLYRIWR